MLVGKSSPLLAPLLLLIPTAACNSVTHIRAPANKQALKSIVEKASSEYSVTWKGENTLRISDWWPVHSIGSLGYTAFHGDFRYDEGEVEADFYLQSNQLLLLFLPLRIDTGPGMAGALLKPYMRKQMDQVLGWGGISVKAEAVSYGSPEEHPPGVKP